MTATTTCGAELDGVLSDLEGWGDTLHRSDRADGEVIHPCREVIEPGFLNRCMDELATTLGTDERMAVVSVWCKYYDAAVVTGALAAMVLRGVGVDVSLERTGMCLREGLPRGLWLLGEAEAVLWRERWPDERGRPPWLTREAGDVEQFRRFVWGRMFGGHLEPFVQRVAEVRGIRPRILWANIGSRCAYLLNVFADQAPWASEADRRALLGSREAPWAKGRNPLYESVREQRLATSTGAVRAQVRKTCCLRDRLPGAELCLNCPRLSCEQRLQRLEAEGWK